MTVSPRPVSLHWQLANEYPATSLPGEGDLRFSQLVAEATANRIRIEVLADGASGLDSVRQAGAVSRGELALADSFAGALGSLDPLFLLPSLPFLTADAAGARRLFDLARPLYDAALAGLNQRLLFASPWPPTGLWTRRPLGVAGLAGLRVRTYDATSAAVLSRLGASARAMPFTEALPLLQAGELDAVLSSGDGGAAAKLWQVLPNFNAIHYAVPLSLVTIGLGAWNGLDAAAQRAVGTAGEQVMAEQWQKLGTRVEENYRRLREHGTAINIEVEPALRAALKAAAAPAIDEWAAAAGPEGTRLLDAFRAGR